MPTICDSTSGSENTLMPDATTAPFIDGQGISVELRDVEAELARLWGPAAEQVGGPDLENPHVTRIVLANLVVECLDGDVESLEPVLETVIARFPCRSILLCPSDGLERKITAQVSALCHLPSPGLPQVCSERIVLRAGRNAVDLLPGAVRSLLEADLPHLLWWTGDPRKHESLFRDLAKECSRIVLDLPDPGWEPGALRLGLDPALGTCSHDTAWFGLARWRELVAQFFDANCHLVKLSRIKSLHLDVVSPDPAQLARPAIWLVAWMAGQLGWKPQGCPVNVPTADSSTSLLLARLLGPSGDVAVSIVTRPIAPGVMAWPQLAGVTVTTRATTDQDSPAETFRLIRPWPGSPAVLVETDAPESCRLPRGVDAPELDAARRVATALESSRIDIPFRNALPIALWLMESAKS
jgi:glucose-6-phosphate dehydrogenase assembly protein OpcA